MKRPAIILVSITISVIGILILGPLFIPADTARDRIAEQITQWIGRSVTFSGEPDIRLFPRPTVRLRDVEIADIDGTGETFISAEELTGTFRFLPLLWGAIEVSAFELVRPTIALRVDEAGQSNWAFDGTLGVRIAEAFSEPQSSDVDREPIGEVVLGRFDIVDGTITFDQPGEDLAILTEVELDVHWPSTAAAATANGSLVWRGEKIDISARLSDPLELIARRDSPARFTIAGQPVHIAFDGLVGRAELNFAFDGETSVTIASLRQIIDWMGSPMADGATLAGAAFSGMASWAWPILSISEAELRLDGNVAGGAVSIDFGGDRARIVGTLAFEELDLSIYADSFRADIEAQGEWRDVPIDLPVLADIDWDMRVSADRLVVGATRIDRFAAAAIVDGGAIDLRLAEAEFYGGSLQASLSGTLIASSLDVEAELILTDIDMAPALDDVVGIASLGGRANATMSAMSDGNGWGEMVQRLTGTVQVSVTSGVLRGIDFAGPAIAQNPSLEAVLVEDSETAFTTLTADFTFFGGQFIADRLDVNGPGFDLAFRGWGSLTSPAIGGVGIVWLHGPNEGGFHELPFNVAGTWLEPIFQDDPNAAAPIGAFPGALNE